MKRVLLVIPKLTSFRFFLTELAEALADSGVDVHLACDVAESSGEPHVLVHPVGFPRGMNLPAHLRAARQLDGIVRRVQPDIVHAHFSAAIFTTALARGRDWPRTIGTFQGLNYTLNTGTAARLARLAETWAAQRLDEVWVLTDDDLTALRRDAPRANAHRQNGFGFGCVLERFHPDCVPPEERRKLRTSFGFGQDDCVFVFVGRRVWFKGYPLVGRAFLAVAGQAPAARLMLVGDADLLHPSGLSADEEATLLAHPQVADAGFQADVPPYLAVSDAMVFPSAREGVPVSVMEATAMGLPVITLDSRGCREVVRNEVNGLIAGAATVEAVADAMLRLARDTQLRQALGRQAFAMRAQFDRSVYVQEQIAIYRQLIIRA